MQVGLQCTALRSEGLVSLTPRGRIPWWSDIRKHCSWSWLWPPLPVRPHGERAKDNPAVQAPQSEELHMDLWCLLRHDWINWCLRRLCNCWLPGKMAYPELITSSRFLSILWQTSTVCSWILTCLVFLLLCSVHLKHIFFLLYQEKNSICEIHIINYRHIKSQKGSLVK